jgi:predicted RNase H-like HicB family nuclease
VTHYIALIHKEAGSSYGVSFPDVPGVIAAADNLDQALSEAAEALAFAAEDWAELTGAPFPKPRSLDALRADKAFAEMAEEAVVAAIPLTTPASEAA